MLRNLIFVTTSGLLLFKKDFVNPVPKAGGLIASLLIAMQAFAQQTTGMVVGYLEFAVVSIVMVSDESSKILCILIYDKEDGEIFGRIVASELLTGFTEDYYSSPQLALRTSNDFLGFNSRIGDIFSDCARPVLYRLQVHRGVIKSFFLADGCDAITSSTVDIDSIGINAYFTTLIGLCQDTLDILGDEHKCVVIYNAQSKLFIWRVLDKSYLVVVLQKNVLPDKYRLAINEAIFVLQKMCYIKANLHIVSRIND